MSHIYIGRLEKVDDGMDERLTAQKSILDHIIFSKHKLLAFVTSDEVDLMDIECLQLDLFGDDAELLLFFGCSIQELSILFLRVFSEPLICKSLTNPEHSEGFIFLGEKRYRIPLDLYAAAKELENGGVFSQVLSSEGVPIASLSEDVCLIRCDRVSVPPEEFIKIMNEKTFKHIKHNLLRISVKNEELSFDPEFNG